MTMAFKHSDWQTNSQTLFQRIAEADKSAVVECMNVYGDFVWCAVKRFTNSDEEAETLVQSVFNDIWQFAGRFDSSKLNENDFISLIIRHRLRQSSAIH